MLTIQISDYTGEVGEYRHYANPQTQHCHNDHESFKIRRAKMQLPHILTVLLVISRVVTNIPAASYKSNATYYYCRIDIISEETK